MENPTVILTLHRDTLELDIDAPELALDVVISLIERAKRALEHQEKLVVAQQMFNTVREMQENSVRAKGILRNLKM